MSDEEPLPQFQCRCCGFRTLFEEPTGTYEICLVCFWEDDPVQTADPDYPIGANQVSLANARQNYLSTGASDPRFLGDVRPPTEREKT